MSKIAFVFSGQGAQYVGMGKDLYDNVAESREVFEKAENTLGFDLKKLCFEGPSEELNKTENTQPAILTVSIAALKALEKEEIKADVTAGFSLGEYSALVCSGILDFETAVALVKKRGKFMQEAVPEGIGAMAAIIGSSNEDIIEICSNISDGIVEVVNYNCPGQIVVAGEKNAVNKAMELSLKKGTMKAVLLPVSAPFHSSMLKKAAENLEEEVSSLDLNEVSTPILTNLTGDYVKNKDDFKNILPMQAMNPVLWEKIIVKMLEDGVDTFVELGPGKTLSGFIKRINRKVAILNVEDFKSLQKTIEVLKN